MRFRWISRRERASIASSNVVSEHMNHHPESDLIAVLTGKKPFHEALG